MLQKTFIAPQEGGEEGGGLRLRLVEKKEKREKRSGAVVSSDP